MTKEQKEDRKMAADRAKVVAVIYRYAPHLAAVARQMQRAAARWGR